MFRAGRESGPPVSCGDVGRSQMVSMSGCLRASIFGRLGETGLLRSFFLSAIPASWISVGLMGNLVVTPAMPANLADRFWT
jgi:hypothetical protein